MGRRSTRENKNYYQEQRDSLGFSRSKVEDDTDGAITEARLIKIENNEVIPTPDDIVNMASVYNAPQLFNHYCTNECAIGKKFVPNVDSIHDLPQITLQVLSSLSTLNNDKERLIEMASDGVITEDEKKDFKTFKSHIIEMSQAIEALKLWVEKSLPDI